MKNIRTINFDAFKRNAAYALASVTLVSSVTGAIIGYGFGKKSGHKDITTPVLDQMETIITVDEYLQNNTVSDLVYPYYQGDTAEAFKSTKEYTDYVLKTNGIDDERNIPNYANIQVPVVVSVDNEYFIRMQNIKEQIKDIEKNNLWVRYTVKSGDLISSISAKASGSYDETIKITREIMVKNGLTEATMIRPGDILLVHNPELGQLKAELIEAEQQLKDNLQGLNRNLS